MRHKVAFLKVQRELCGHNTLNGYLHDLDKIIMYMYLPACIVKFIHRRISKHHFESWRKPDYELIVIDWECARFTKSDKQLNARQTLTTKFPSKKDLIEPILIKFNL